MPIKSRGFNRSKYNKNLKLINQIIIIYLFISLRSIFKDRINQTLYLRMHNHYAVVGRLSYYLTRLYL